MEAFSFFDFSNKNSTSSLTTFTFLCFRHSLNSRNSCSLYFSGNNSEFIADAALIQPLELYFCCNVRLIDIVSASHFKQLFVWNICVSTTANQYLWFVWICVGDCLRISVLIYVFRRDVKVSFVTRQKVLFPFSHDIPVTLARKRLIFKPSYEIYYYASVYFWIITIQDSTVYSKILEIAKRIADVFPNRTPLNLSPIYHSYNLEFSMVW